MTPPRLYIAAVHAPDWLALGLKLDRVFACGIAGVDVRIARLDYGPTKAERELARVVSEARLEVRCHAWVGHRSGDVAAVDAAMGKRDGHIAGAQCAGLGAKSFGANAERDVWRGPNGRAHPGAVDYLDAFADYFHEANHLADLDYLGFADPAWHYRAADLDGDGVPDNVIPLHVRAEFVRVGVMAYQTRLEDVRKTIARALRRWPEHAESQDVVPWLGVGRLDGDGFMVGSAEASAVVARECGEATFYVGFGAIGQLLDGHARHPPLVALVPKILESA